MKAGRDTNHRGNWLQLQFKVDYRFILSVALLVIAVAALVLVHRLV